jgi:predicted DNA-binding transcriptional regulator AlpA
MRKLPPFFVFSPFAAAAQSVASFDRPQEHMGVRGMQQAQDAPLHVKDCQMTVRKTDSLLRGDRTPAYAADTSKGVRPPAFLSKASLAHELDMAESTVDEMVRRGVLPKPVKLSAGCVRWSWTAVEYALASLGGTIEDSDPFMAGAKHATKTATEGSRGTS